MAQRDDAVIADFADDGYQFVCEGVAFVSNISCRESIAAACDAERVDCTARHVHRWHRLAVEASFPPVWLTFSVACRPNCLLAVGGLVSASVRIAKERRRREWLGRARGPNSCRAPLPRRVLAAGFKSPISPTEQGRNLRHPVQASAETMYHRGSSRALAPASVLPLVPPHQRCARGRSP